MSSDGGASGGVGAEAVAGTSASFNTATLKKDEIEDSWSEAECQPKLDAATKNKVKKYRKKRSKVEATKTNAEMAQQFRENCDLDPMPIIKRFFCCVCGDPAGKDGYACSSRGHVTCKLCVDELELDFCFYDVAYDDEIEENVKTEFDDDYERCRATIHQFESGFRDFVCDNTKLFCLNKTKGCDFIGNWEKMQEHAKDCGFKDSPVSEEDNPVIPEKKNLPLLWNLNLN